MVRLLVIHLNMFVDDLFLNDSLSESVFYSCRNSTWRWLAAHILYSFFFSASINIFLYMASLIVNFRELFLNPSVEYGQRFQGHEQAEAIKYGCRQLKLFLLQLLVLTFAYVLGAYYYKSIVFSTSVDWLSLARWWIEASCDFLHFYTFIVSVLLIPASQTEVDSHFAVVMDMLLVIKMNQFVMMRYAEFYPRACANSIRVVFFNFLCPRADGYPMNRLFAVCVFPTELLPDSFRRTDSSLSV
jgi:hypothetical protein